MCLRSIRERAYATKEVLEVGGGGGNGGRSLDLEDNIGQIFIVSGGA